MSEKTKTLVEKLIAVQSELKAPKNMYNSFGKYKYRNLESICEAAKPLLAKNGLLLTLSDDIEYKSEEWVHVIATATITDGKDSISVTGRAHESKTKTGMDAAQITGAASSYARKYALNGLFLIDDTKDPDTDEYTNQQNNGKSAQKPAPSNATEKGASSTRTYHADEIRLAIDAAMSAKTRDELKMIAESYPGLNTIDPMFKKAMNERWTQVS